MNELIGEFQHKFDTKFRLSLPSKIRSSIGESVIATRGLDGCVYVYSTLDWEVITTQLRSLSLGSAASRSFSRFILSSAIQVAIDKSGRILLPENLRNHADLTQEVVIAGVGNRLELWNPDKWQAQQQAITENVDQLAEDLSDLGMI